MLGRSLASTTVSRQRKHMSHGNETREFKRAAPEQERLRGRGRWGPGAAGGPERNGDTRWKDTEYRIHTEYI